MVHGTVNYKTNQKLERSAAFGEVAIHLADCGWRLEKAWRTGAHGNIAEEFPISGVHCRRRGVFEGAG
jgi:hypothetical protein